MADNLQPIVFEWQGKTYSITEGRNMIILPTLEVLKAVYRAGVVNPPQIAKLTSFISFYLTPISPSLAQIAREMDAVLATQVHITNPIFSCPNGCSNPTHPFCSQCGSRVNTTDFIVSAPHLSSLNIEVNVKGNGPCPTCSAKLVHDHHAKVCPTCGQALKWICR